MKALLPIAALALIATTSFAPPANAQYGGYGFDRGYGAQFNTGYGYNFSGRTAQLHARIDVGLRSGRLTQREASSLRARVAQVAALEARMRASGNRLTRAERNRLNNQISRLNMQITREMNDFERRGGRGIRGGFPWF